MKTNSNTLEDKKDRLQGADNGTWEVHPKLCTFKDNNGFYGEEERYKYYEIDSNTPGRTEWIAHVLDSQYTNGKANAEHIVKCVNAFPELIAALQLAREYVLQFKQRGMIGEIEKDLAKINSALTKVK